MTDSFSKEIIIDGKAISTEGESVYVIAEAGVAHFGSLDKAYRLVDLAVEAKADAVKFQIFKAKDLISQDSMDWRERLGSRELPYDDFKKIQAYCKKKGITFFATAHDEPALEYLADLDVPVYKIGSGEIGNWPFLKKIASLGKPVIFSTGMYTLDQVGEALQVMASTGNRDLAVLHCVTRYPSPPEEINLRAIETIRDKFNVITGYSDHTKGFHIPLAAVALNASIIEKHITLDFDVPNASDWKVSCGSDDLGLFVSQIREIKLAMGNGIKLPSEEEMVSLVWASKSLVASINIGAGEVLTENNVVTKRPGGGISPSEWPLIIGKKVREDIQSDTVIKREFICE